MDTPEDARRDSQKVLCPICAEPIMPQAKKCIHCGEFLEGHTGWTWSEWLTFRPKTLWDVMSLLVMPVFLVLAGFWLCRIESDRLANLATANASLVTSTAEARATNAAGRPARLKRW